MRDHLQPEEMLALLDGELPEAERHLQDCPDCREQIEAIRSGLAEYLTWHEQVLKPFAGAASTRWKSLDSAMDAVDSRLARGRWSVQRQAAPPATPVPLMQPRRGWWGLAAAAAAVLVLGYLGYHRLPSVQAAELLEKAVAAEHPVRPDMVIRMKTRSREFVRPAILRKSAPAEGSELAPLFEAARYDWVQPFGARAFSEWRGRLPDKHDRIEYQDAVCLIHTSSDSNALAQATLVLRSSDWAPVRETLEFRENDIVEIWSASSQTGIPEGVVPSPAAPGPRATDPTAPRVPPGILTLHVLAALHTIKADLGELELHPNGDRLVLRATGLSAARREEIRHAVAGIDGVDLAFGDDSGGPAAASTARKQGQKPEGPAPLRALLESKLPEGTPVEDAVNQILDASDAMMAQAFALHALAGRYPPEEERLLAEADRELLARVRGDYGRELHVRVSQLAQLTAPLLTANPATARASSWQKGAEQAFNAAQALDSMLSEMLAGPPRSSPPRAELLRQLESAVARAQAAVGMVQ